MTNIQEIITAKLDAAFQPIHLTIINESHNHKTLPDAESHFKIILVSDKFECISRIARHQMIYALLEKQLHSSIHALALHLYTKKEWQSVNGQFHASPACQGAQQ